MPAEKENKPVVVYLRTNPMGPGITYIAIDTSTEPYSVFGVYRSDKIIPTTNRVGSIIILIKDVAAEFYEFRQQKHENFFEDQSL